MPKSPELPEYTESYEDSPSPVFDETDGGITAFIPLPIMPGSDARFFRGPTPVTIPDPIVERLRQNFQPQKLN